MVKKYRYILFTMVAIVLVAGGYVKGDTDRKRKESIVSLAEDLKRQAELSIAIDKTRAQEREKAQAMVNISTQYQKGLENGKNDLQAALDRRTTELDRLRRQQAANSDKSVSTVSTSPRRCDETRNAYFLITHGENALRLASECNAVVNQLTACQQIVENDRK